MQARGVLLGEYEPQCHTGSCGGDGVGAGYVRDALPAIVEEAEGELFTDYIVYRG